ncbi:MAG: hypothetical protein Q8N23_28695 [Archangium sp.]|nr:hypothetical protein [Archangium sp.]MDP3570626.1 hypothetical protein [Archangium sp.]
MSGGTDQAFALAAAELGMASAAWLFTAEADASEGPEAVQGLRDVLGRNWPVLDAVCAAWQSGARPPRVDATGLAQRLTGITRVVVVGLEVRWLDALVKALPASVRVALVRHSEFSPDWERVLANFGGRVELLELSEFQSWAGQRSVLLSFVYGAGGAEGLFALSAWVRVSGPDVRTQFRQLLGWDVLSVPLSIYPRWLVAVSATDFTQLELAE